MKVKYKGMDVPAKMVRFNMRISKLIPISTDRYTLHGVPKPKGVDVADKTTIIAKNIIKTNKELSGIRKSIIARYIRKGMIDGFVLNRKYNEKGNKRYSISKGAPIGLLVAFVHNNKVMVGWSKIMLGQTIKYGKIKQKEPLVFAKKDAMLLAVERGLVDTITFHKSKSNAYTKEGLPVPKVITNELDNFIKRCEKYFKKEIFNVSMETSRGNNDKKRNGEVP